MVLYSLYIINKDGGLIFQRSFNKGMNTLTTNDHLRLAGTFHTMHAISSTLGPKPSSGIQCIETGDFTLHCYLTPTGTKFFVIIDPSHPPLSPMFQSLYEAYAEYVLKNPFYQLNQPIKCTRFIQKVDALLSKI
eukprot:GCRY01005552.1.p1 GENE.GCRY01005552.1~~GCRY01005552.1.p1  ORF type:complete len:134 (+),score=18.47 GCRY01005552.1:312-713(+)